MSKAQPQLQEAIEKHGWAIVGTETEMGYPFTYTLGLRDHLNHPDIIILGMGYNQAAEILHSMIEVIADGDKFEDGSESLKIIRNADTGFSLPVRFIEVHDRYKAQYMCQTCYHYEVDADAFGALQMLWPDKDNNFPTCPGYDHNIQYILQD